MKMLLVGDISPSPENNHLFGSGNVEALFSDVAPMFQQYDVNIVNLECSLTESETQIKKIGPPLKASVGTAATLKKLGVDYCNLSNNHFFDYGRKGVKDSLEALDQVKMPYTGFGNNLEESRKDLIIEKNGQKIAVIAVCEHEYSYALEDRMGTRPFDVFQTPLDIRAAKEKADRVIVLYHGGKEFCRYPSPRLRSACRAMAQHGADLVLCQHTHCIGTYEKFGESHIVYGQGNFHFVNQKLSNRPGWKEGLGAIYDTVENTLELVPVVQKDEVGIRLANAQEKEEILSGIQERSATLHDGTWRQHWHDYCMQESEFYTRVATQACVPEFGEAGVQRLAHFLDCEAHSDVWHELFPTYNQTNEKD